MLVNLLLRYKLNKFESPSLKIYDGYFIPVASPLEDISANNIHRRRLTNRDSLSNYPVALFAVLVAEETLYILHYIPVVSVRLRTTPAKICTVSTNEILRGFIFCCPRLG